MITIKRSQIIRKTKDDSSQLIKKFSALNFFPVTQPVLSTVERWIVPIYTKTYDDSLDSTSISLQQTSIYSYLGRELIKVDIPENVDLKMFLFERFGLSPDDKYIVYRFDSLIFIYLSDSLSIASQPECSWNNILSMFKLEQPDRVSYTNPYSALLHGYCNDIYDMWYKQKIDTQLKLQNSSETVPLRMVFELCEKLV